MELFLQNFFQKYKIEIIIFGIALLARVVALLLAVYNHGEGILYLSDSGAFVDLALSLALGTGYSGDGGLNSHALYVPGYPFFLAVSSFLFGNLWPALITQILLSSLVPVLILRIGNILGFSSKISLVGALLSALEPHLVIFSIVYMTEALYGFLFMAGVLFFAQFLKNQLLTYVFLSSITLGLAAYVKVSNYLVFLYLAAIIFYLRLIKADMKKVFTTAAIFLSVFIAMIFPWFLRNYYHSGLWRMSSHEAYNLYVYDGASILSLRDGISYEGGKKIRLDSWKEETGTDVNIVANNLNLAELMHKKGVEFAVQNLGSTMKLAILTSISFWTSHNYAYFLTYFYTVFDKPSYVIPPTQLLFQGKIGETFYGTLKFITTPYYLVSLGGKILRLLLAVLAFFGIWNLYKSADYARKSFAVLAGLIFIYYTIMAFGAGFGIEGRVRYPIEPLLMLTAVVGLNGFRYSYIRKNS